MNHYGAVQERRPLQEIPFTPRSEHSADFPSFRVINTLTQACNAFVGGAKAQAKALSQRAKELEQHMKEFHSQVCRKFAAMCCGCADTCCTNL
jgi:hypothetical protein